MSIGDDAAAGANDRWPSLRYEMEAIEAETHELAVDDFGNQYLARVVAVPSLREALRYALSQWEMYADGGRTVMEDWVRDAADAEADQFRWASSALRAPEPQREPGAPSLDREMAAMQSRLAKYDAAFARAKELVRGSPVDWTNDPPSKGPDGWWQYTSQNNREVLMAAVAEARQQGRDREPLDVDRLTAAILAARSYNPDDPTEWDTPFVARHQAAAIAEEWARGPQVRGGG